jgi:hypothetical protein
VNATASTATASLGGLYRSLKGSQAPNANTGHLAYAITIGPHDGRVLASADATQLAESMRAARADWLTAAARARTAAAHFLPLTKSGSRTKRAAAKRVRSAWLAAAKKAGAAATRCSTAADKLVSARSAAPGAVKAASSASTAALKAAKSALVKRAAASASAARTAATAANSRAQAVYTSPR